MNPRLFTLIVIVVLLATFRIVPHPPNVTPIAALALFAGAHFTSRSVALLLPLAALFLSDMVLGFHSSMFFVYFAFLLTVVIGFGLRYRLSPLSLVSAASLSSIAFFIISNFGAWLMLEMYPKTAEGLWSAYVAGIPFFRNSLFGDLGYTIIVFTGFYLVERYIPSVRVPQVSPKG